MSDEATARKMMEVAGYTDIAFERVEAPVRVGDDGEDAIAFQLAMFLGDGDAAVHWARSATLVPNAHYRARAKLISWLAHTGDVTGARASVPALLRSCPSFSCDFARSRLFFVRVPEHTQLFPDGLRRAGVPQAGEHGSLRHEKGRWGEARHIL